MLREVSEEGDCLFTCTEKVIDVLHKVCEHDALETSSVLPLRILCARSVSEDEFKHIKGLENEQEDVCDELENLLTYQIP